MQDEQRSFVATREGIEQTSIQLLFADAGLALTFIAIAETTQSRETAERNIENARKAYDSIQHLREKYALATAEETTLDSQLAEIRVRLEALGEKF